MARPAAIPWGKIAALTPPGQTEEWAFGLELSGVAHPKWLSGPMARTFKRGDHVAWCSEAGRVRGTVIKRVTSDTRFKGYVHHASKDEPQYIIKSDKTDHIAIHRGKH